MCQESVLFLSIDDVQTVCIELVGQECMANRMGVIHSQQCSLWFDVSSNILALSFFLLFHVRVFIKNTLFSPSVVVSIATFVDLFHEQRASVRAGRAKIESGILKEYPPF